MHKNSIRLLVSISVLAVVAAGVTVVGQNRTRDVFDESAAFTKDFRGQAKEAPPVEKRIVSAPVDSGSSGPSTTRPAALVPHPFPNVPRSRAGLPLEEDPFTATSPAEQAWLDRNGYPNAIQWETYSQASDGLLLAAASAGDSVAKAVLDNRRLMAGDKSALQDILGSGAEGSLFSLELASSYLAGSSKGDPITAYALSRVVEMKGNLRVAMGRDAMFRKPLDPLQRMEGEAKALAIYRSLNAANRSGRNNVVDPRPIDG